MADTPVYSAVGVVVIFFLSLAGSLLPPFLVRFRPGVDLDSNLIFRFSNGMAAGIVLAVGFVHSLPDASESFESALGPLAEEADDAGEPSSLYTFAWPGFLAMVGAILTFTLEEVLEQMGVSTHDHGTGHAHHGSHSIPESGPRAYGALPASAMEEGADQGNAKAFNNAATEDSSRFGLDQNPGEAAALMPSKQERNKLMMDMYVLLAGLSFHSFFVGLALGVSNSLALFIAILAHQFFEGIALGARVARAQLHRRLHIWVIDLIFSFAAPLGGVIGIAISEGVGDDGFVFDIINGVFQALSAGILIYVAIIHLLSEEMDRHSMKDGRAARNITYLGFMVGCAIMSIIGIWA